MSFGALPTELDNRILAFLTHDALNAMSKVSRTYREVSEPFLYRHLDLITPNDVSVRWLVVTLIYRSELAVHIRTLKLVERDSTAEEYAMYNQRVHQPAELLEQAVDKLLKIISHALGSSPAMAKSRVTWLGAILADNHVEGSLALIVYMAVNLESLTLKDILLPGVTTGYHGALLTSVIWEVFSHSYEDPTRKLRSLSKLQSLHLETRSPVQISTLPHLRTLCIRNSDEFTVSHLFPSYTSHQLQTLEIIDTYGSPDSLSGLSSITSQQISGQWEKLSSKRTSQCGLGRQSRDYSWIVMAGTMACHLRTCQITNRRQ